MTSRGKISLVLAGGQIVFKNASAGPEGVSLAAEEVLACFSDDVKEKICLADWSHQPICHYSLRMCGDLVQMAGMQIEEGAAGVVVTCGTQALTEAAYYADLVWNYPQPLIFTASIFRAGSLGSETALHLTQAVNAAESRACWGHGVLVCVQDKIYAGSELHHLSNYSRDGYTAWPCGPVAEFSEPEGPLLFLRAPRRGRILDVGISPARNVEIIDTSLGGGDVLLDAILGGHAAELNGLVISGFAGGDVPPSWVPPLRKILRDNVPVVLASRCPLGRVQTGDDFEGAAKRLLEMGLISAGSLTPQQARIRLALGLGADLQDQDLRAYMADE